MQAWRVVLATVVLAGGSAAAWVGWNEHLYRQEIQALTPQVRLVRADSLRLDVPYSARLDSAGDQAIAIRTGAAG